MVSHSDPEMRHGRKSASRRFDGHKLDVIIDEASEMVLGVEVRAGNAGDGEGAAPLLSKVTGTEGIEVATLLADMAYSDGDVREAVEAQGTDLVAKVPPVTNSGRFPKTEFNIDLGAGTVTCPAGQTTSDARRAKDHKGRPATMFYFDARTCEICPLRERCTAGKGGRTIMVGRHHRRIEAARAAQAEPETKALLRRRAKVERKIDHLQDLGMRKARYRGRRKTRLQALSGRHRRQLQALGCARRAPSEPPSPPRKPLEGRPAPPEAPGTAIKPLQPSLTPSSGQSRRSGRRKRSAHNAETAPQNRHLLLTHLGPDAAPSSGYTAARDSITSTLLATSLNRGDAASMKRPTRLAYP